MSKPTEPMAENMSDLIQMALSPLDSFIGIMRVASDGHDAVEVAQTLMDSAKRKIDHIIGFVDKNIGRVRIISEPDREDSFIRAELMK